MTSIITPSRKDYLPEGATCLTREGVKAEVWNFTNSAGKPAAMGFKGRAQKPAFHYWFSDAKKRACRVNAFFDAVAQAGRDAAARRAERFQPHNFAIGTVLSTSWGYEQTNVEFYQITGLIGKNTVELVEIGKKRAAYGGDCGHSMAENVVADPSNKRGGPFRRKVDMSCGDASVKIHDCADATLWKGKPEYCSWGLMTKRAKFPKLALMY